MSELWSPLQLDASPRQAPYRSFAVTLPTGQRYWTVLGSDDLRVQLADEFLFDRLARGAASTTETYAGAIGYLLTWAAMTNRAPSVAPESFGRFVFWLRRYDSRREQFVGPGLDDVRGPSRINTILAGVREFYQHLVAVKALPHSVVDPLYRIVDDRWMPADARRESTSLRYRMKPIHRVKVIEKGIPRATDEEAAALIRACLNARDRLIVMLAVRVGLRRGEIAGLRLSDIHLLPGKRLGCRSDGPHLHVIKRENPNRAAAKSRVSRELPCDPMVVRSFDDWSAERDMIGGAAVCDFVVVTLGGPNPGSSIRPGLINEVFESLVSRAGLDRNIHPHMLRHAMLSNILDHGGTIDEAQVLAGHASPDTTSRTYLHPAAARLREAVERVPIPRDTT